MNKTDSIIERVEPRRSAHLPLRVQGTDARGQFFVEVVLTENVSNSGACVTLTQQVSVGERLHVFISNGSLQTQAIGHARWVNDENGRCRVGLKFERPPKAWYLNGTPPEYS